MPNNQELLERLKSLRKLKKSKAFYAKVLGISELELRELFDQLKGKTSNPFTSNSTTYISESKDAKEIGIQLPNEIKNLEELIEKCNIDTEVWEIDKYVQNYWGNNEHPYWQVKAWLSKKKKEEVEVLAEVLSTYKSNYVPLRKSDIFINTEFPNPVLALISLADPHIDKKTLDGSTIEEKMISYLDILLKLLSRASRANNVDEIIFVLGNDYFTSDTYHGSTTNLTPQNTTTTYDDSYEKGFDLAVTAINMCKQFCNKLNVIFVPANHDRTKSFYLLHALEIYFAKERTIKFDRTAENTKVYTYGQNFLGFHHGDTNMEKLPLYFAAKYKKQWGECKHTEIALADKHHKQQWKMPLSEKEVNGIRMFISPALTAPDVWHKDKTYDLAQLAGVVRYYDKERGYCGEAEERI